MRCHVCFRKISQVQQIQTRGDVFRLNFPSPGEAQLEARRAALDKREEDLQAGGLSIGSRR